MLRHADAQTPQIVSGTAYQHNGNHILSQTDARGKTVTHDIDENTDLTRAVTDPNGQQVQYAYDSTPRHAGIRFRRRQAVQKRLRLRKRPP